MPSLTPGQSLGPYRVIRRLGAGGMGEVWLAEDARLQRLVALKTLLTPDRADALGHERLRREARAAAALTHPGIAAVHDVLDLDGEVALVFEFVEGETLHARLRRAPLPVAEAVDFATQIAEALDAAHRHGVIHRDLKPANVIITPEGRIKVLDFGVARHVPADAITRAAGEITGTREIVGTPGYAAPEQWTTGHVDERADLFALGVMLFEMVAGRRPFAGHDALALATAMLSQDAPRLRSVAAGIPAGLDGLVAHLLARSPDKRPSSARQVLDELRSSTTTRTRSVFGMQRRPGRLTLAVGCFLLVVVTGLVGWLRMKDPAATMRADLPPVIAVLPLANLSGDATRDYVAAGIADSLITSLAAVPSVTVLSRAAVAEARGRAPDLAALFGELDATFMVEGSVQQVGQRLQVSLSLVRARDRAVAWSASFEGAFDEIFELQARLARAVGAALATHIRGISALTKAYQPTQSAPALSAYWRGRAFLDRLDVKGNLEAAASAFREAIASDPRFALAHAALAEAHWRQYAETRQAGWMEKAVDSSTTALRFDPEQPEVRYTLGVVLAAQGKLDDAADELQRALVLRPTFDEAHRQLGQVLARQGHIKEASAAFQKAIALRPTYWGHFSALGLAMFNAAEYREAAAAFEQVTRLQPDNYLGFQQLGTVYQRLGDTDQAVLNYQRSIAIRPSPGAFTNIGVLYHERGDFAQAVDAHLKAIALRPNSHAIHRNLGDAYRRLGRTADAVAAYRAAVRLVDDELKVNPRDALNVASLAVYLGKAGDVDGARQRIGEALRMAPADIQVQFNAAVVHALAGRSDSAVAALRDAVAGGYSTSAILAEEDFVSLRERPDFRALVAR